MKSLLTLVVAAGLVGCSIAPPPSKERIFGVWRVDSFATLEADPKVKTLNPSHYGTLKKLVSEGLGKHRYAFRRSGELAFGSSHGGIFGFGAEPLKPIAHFALLEEKGESLFVKLDTVGSTEGRTETAEVWFEGRRMYLKRGGQTLALHPD